jgi:hypothetical protein
MRTGLSVSTSVANHQLAWSEMDRVIHLKLSGNYRPEDAAEISIKISQMIREGRQPKSVVLVIDAMNMNVLTQFEQIRAVQGFIFEPNLGYIFVATDNKLLRLAFMVMFKLSTAYVRLFDSVPELNSYIEQSINALP